MLDESMEVVCTTGFYSAGQSLHETPAKFLPIESANEQTINGSIMLLKHGAYIWWPLFHKEKIDAG